MTKYRKANNFASKTPRMPQVQKGHLSNLLKVVCLLMTAFISEPAIKTVQGQATAVDCTPSGLTVITPAVFERNCESWVTAIDVDDGDKIAVAINSKLGDSTCSSLTGQTDIEVQYLSQPSVIQWQIKVTTQASSSFTIQQVVSIRIGANKQTMMLGVDAVQTSDSKPAIVLVYLSGIDSATPSITYGYKFQWNGLKLPSATDTIDINTGHTIGLYQDKMFFLAWPTQTSGTYKSLIGIVQSTSTTKILMNERDPNNEGLSLDGGASFDRMPCLSCAMATFDQFSDNNQYIVVAGVTFYQDAGRIRHYVSIIDVNNVNAEPKSYYMKLSSAYYSSVQVVRAVKLDSSISGFDHTIGVCGHGMKTDNENSIVGYFLKFKMANQEIDIDSNNKGFEIKTSLDTKLYCKDMAIDKQQSGQHGRSYVLVSRADQKQTFLVEIKYKKNEYSFDKLEESKSWYFAEDTGSAGIVVHNHGYQDMYSLPSIYFTDTVFNGFAWGGSVKSWTSNNIDDYTTSLGHAYIMVSDSSKADGQFSSATTQDTKSLISITEMSSFEYKVYDSNWFDNFRKFLLTDYANVDIKDSLSQTNVNPVPAPKSFNKQSASSYTEALAKEDFEVSTDDTATAQQNVEIEFELALKKYCTEMEYTPQIDTFNKHADAPSVSGQSHYPTITFVQVTQNPGDSTFKMKYKVTFTDNNQAGNWRIRLRAVMKSDSSITLDQTGKLDITVPYIAPPTPIPTPSLNPPKSNNTGPILSSTYGPIFLSQDSENYTLKISSSDIKDSQQDTLNTSWIFSPLALTFIEVISDLELKIFPSMSAPPGRYVIFFVIQEVNTTEMYQRKIPIEIYIKEAIVEQQEEQQEIEVEVELQQPVVQVKIPEKVKVETKDNKSEQLMMLVPKIQEQKDESRIPITIHIRLIDQIGHVFIEFSENLLPIDEFVGLNTTIISNEFFFNVTYQNQADIDSKREGNLDTDPSIPILEGWKVVNFTKRQMVVKLNFTNPIMVSSSSDRDTITIRALITTIFKAQRDGSYLLEKFAQVMSPIPIQMQSEEQFYITQDSANQSRNSMDFGILLTLVIQLFFSMSMHLIWGIINALQLVTNLKRMERIQTPGRVILLLETIDGTVNLRIHEQPHIKALLQEHLDSLLLAIESIGFAFVAMITLVTIILIILILQTILKKYEKAQKLINKIKAKLMWSSVLRALFQGFFILTLATSAHLFGGTHNDESVEYGAVNIVLDSIKLLILLCFPIGIAIFMIMQKNKLPTEEFILKYGTVYGQVRVESKVSDMPLWNPTIFLTKRLLIALATAAFNPQHNQMIISVYVFLQVFNLSFVIAYKPMNEPFLNFLEGLNETFVLVTAYLMILFTDFIPEIETRILVGEYFYYFIFGVMGLNLLVIIGAVSLELFKKVRRWWRRRQAVKAEQAKLNKQMLEQQSNDQSISSNSSEDSSSSQSSNNESSSSSSISQSTPIRSQSNPLSSGNTSSSLTSSPVSPNFQKPQIVVSSLQAAQPVSNKQSIGKYKLPKQQNKNHLKVPQPSVKPVMKQQSTRPGASQPKPQNKKVSEIFKQVIKKSVEREIANKKNNQKMNHQKKQQLPKQNQNPSAPTNNTQKQSIKMPPKPPAPIGKIRNLADYVNFKRSVADLYRYKQAQLQQAKLQQAENSSLPEESPRFPEPAGQDMVSSRFKKNDAMNVLSTQKKATETKGKQKRRQGQ